MNIKANVNMIVKEIVNVNVNVNMNMNMNVNVKVNVNMEDNAKCQVCL